MPLRRESNISGRTKIMPAEKTEVVKIRIESTDKNELHRIAVAESRTFAGQCRAILKNWLKNRKIKNIETA